MTMRLHYIYDPLCGWCYGAAPLLRVARELLPVQAHAGGMMTGANRQPVTPQLRQYVMSHDQRIAKMSGQPFGQAYTDGLLNDNSAVFDSTPPTAAILAAEQLAGRGLDMLAALQQAHYVDGRRIADSQVLIEVATSLGLDEADFTRTLSDVSGEPVQAHIHATQALMQQLGARGFPTLMLETADGWQTIDLSAFIGQPDAFRHSLASGLASLTAHDSQAPFAPKHIV